MFFYNIYLCPYYLFVILFVVLNSVYVFKFLSQIFKQTGSNVDRIIFSSSNCFWIGYFRTVLKKTMDIVVRIVSKFCVKLNSSMPSGNKKVTHT